MNGHQRVMGIFKGTLVAVLALLILTTPMGLPEETSAKGPEILIYYDGHMHSTRSDGSGSVADIKEMALRRGLNAVIITDHCKSLTVEKWASLVAETAAASDKSFLALPGFEVTGSDGIFNRDHINALGAPDPFVGDDALELCPEEVWESPPNPAGTGPLYPENLARWSEYIQSQGGIAVHNHPSGTTSPAYGMSHLEVYNQSHVEDVASYAVALGYPPTQAWGFGLTLNNFTLYGERDVNMLVPFPGYGNIPLRTALYLATRQFTGIGQWLGAPEAPLHSWDELLMAYVVGALDRPILGLANSDAHNTGDLTCGDASGCSNVGIVKNGVYVKAFNAKELYKAIAAGRTFGTTGPSLALDVNGRLMGERAVIPQGTAQIGLRVSSESPAALLVKIDVCSFANVGISYL